MKKLILGIASLMLGLLIAILIISKTKHVTYEIKCYAIPRIQTYSYDEDKRMTFEVFINDTTHLIEYPEKNQYYLKDTQGQYQLNHVNVIKEEDSVLQEEIYYKYSISCDILGIQETNMILTNCFLIIESESFNITIPIGDLEIYKESYEPLEYSDLYGNYAYVNGELHCIGIIIQLNPMYKSIQKVQIGSAFSILEYIEEDILYDSERLESSLKHPVITEWIPSNPHVLTAKQNYYFIPISYETLHLITTACILFQIDGKTYYIEDFTYLASPIHLSQYPNCRQEGTIKYA